MEFKVGDKIRVSKENTHNLDSFPAGTTGTIINIDSSNVPYKCDFNVSEGTRIGWVRDIEPIDSTEIPKVKNMSKIKKVYSVLVVNKKTGKEQQKTSTVIADSEQHATLKAFGVDVDNLFIKVDEVGEYQEEKPIEVVNAKSEK